MALCVCVCTHAAYAPNVALCAVPADGDNLRPEDLCGSSAMVVPTVVVAAALLLVVELRGPRCETGSGKRASGHALAEVATRSGLAPLEVAARSGSWRAAEPG